MNAAFAPAPADPHAAPAPATGAHPAIALIEQRAGDILLQRGAKIREDSDDAHRSARRALGANVDREQTAERGH